MKFNKVYSIIYIVILSLCFFQRNKYIQVSNELANVFTIFLLVFTICIFISRKLVKNDKTNNLENKKMYKLLLFFILPYIVIGIYSIIITLCNDFYKDELLKRTGITVGMFLISILLAYFSVKVFEKKIIKYTLMACLLNYSIVLIIFILNNGISGLLNFRYLNDNFIDISLEVHEIAYIFALFLLYFIIYKKPEKKILYGILCLFLFLGMKRIIVGALLFIGIIYVFTKFLKLKKELIIKLNRIISISIVVIYLILSTVELDQFKVLFDKLGIDMMGRGALYEYFQDQCHFGITYFGKGIRSTDLLLSLSPRLKYYSAIHNDILRIYFELGFIMFFMYFINYIILNNKRIEKEINVKASLLYSYLTLFSIICYTTDNTFVYYRYLFIFYIIVFFSIYDNLKKEELT